MMKPVPRWYVMAAILVSSLSIGLASVVYANHVALESERKWCSIVATMDDAYKAQPPITESGKNVARDIDKLRSSLRCP